MSSWVVDKVAGIGRPPGDNAPASAALLHDPFAIVTDSANSFYFTEQRGGRVRKVDSTGRITTVAGNGSLGYKGDGGLATAASIDQPTGIAIDPAGNLYISDFGFHVVRRITPDGIISTVAGTGLQGFSGDGGPAKLAQLNEPWALSFRDGYLYIADTENNRIRRVSPSGVISTVAGTGVDKKSPGGPAATTPMSQPVALAFDKNGTLYIAEFGSNSVVAMSPDFFLTPIAGSGTSGFSGDGGSAVKANLAVPFGLAVDGAGAVFVSD